MADIIRDVGVAYAETKYDGERYNLIAENPVLHIQESPVNCLKLQFRMQIHVNMDSDSKIKIFSKSKRDSTIDRQLTHP